MIIFRQDWVIPIYGCAGLCQTDMKGVASNTNKNNFTFPAVKRLPFSVNLIEVKFLFLPSVLICRFDK